MYTGCVCCVCRSRVGKCCTHVSLLHEQSCYCPSVSEATYCICAYKVWYTVFMHLGSIKWCFISLRHRLVIILCGPIDIDQQLWQSVAKLFTISVCPWHADSLQTDELYFAKCHYQRNNIVQLVLLEGIYPTCFLYIHPVFRPRLHSLFRFPTDEIVHCLFEQTTIHSLGCGPDYGLKRADNV